VIKFSYIGAVISTSVLLNLEGNKIRIRNDQNIDEVVLQSEVRVTEIVKRTSEFLSRARFLLIIQGNKSLPVNTSYRISHCDLIYEFSQKFTRYWIYSENILRSVSKVKASYPKVSETFKEVCTIMLKSMPKGARFSNF
jgi:hypothetical protein